MAVFPPEKATQHICSHLLNQPYQLVFRYGCIWNKKNLPKKAKCRTDDGSNVPIQNNTPEACFDQDSNRESNVQRNLRYQLSDHYWYFLIDFGFKLESFECSNMTYEHFESFKYSNKNAFFTMSKIQIQCALSKFQNLSV